MKQNPLDEFVRDVIVPTLVERFLQGAHRSHGHGRLSKKDVAKPRFEP